VKRLYSESLTAEKDYLKAAVPRIPVSGTPLIFAVNVPVQLDPKKLLLAYFLLWNVRVRMFPEETLAPVTLDAFTV